MLHLSRSGGIARSGKSLEHAVELTIEDRGGGAAQDRFDMMLGARPGRPRRAQNLPALVGQVQAARAAIAGVGHCAGYATA